MGDGRIGLNNRNALVVNLQSRNGSSGDRNLQGGLLSEKAQGAGRGRSGVADREDQLLKFEVRGAAQLENREVVGLDFHDGDVLPPFGDAGAVLLDLVVVHVPVGDVDLLDHLVLDDLGGVLLNPFLNQCRGVLGGQLFTCLLEFLQGEVDDHLVEYFALVLIVIVAELNDMAVGSHIAVGVDDEARAGGSVSALFLNGRLVLLILDGDDDS